MPFAASGASSRNGLPRVEQRVDPVARQQLAAGDVPLAGALGTAERAARRAASRRSATKPLVLLTARLTAL